MARTPRTRRAKRTTDFQQPATAARTRDRRRQVKPVQQAKSQTGAQRERRGGIRAFVKECWGELKKVEWPSRSQVIQGTIVVIIACAIVGTYLYAADQFFKPFVRNVLLGQ